MFAVAKEVTEFEGLLDLFKERFDSPPTSVQVANAPGRPLEIIRYERHDHDFTLNLHLGFNPPKSFPILLSAFAHLEHDFIVPENVALTLVQVFAADPIAHVVLCPANPINPSLRQFLKMLEMNVGFVEDYDFPGLQGRTQGQRTSAVVVGCFLDDGESRKKRLKVQT